MPLRVLVLGGARFIGRELVHRLAARGHEVTVFNRGDGPEAPPPGVRAVVGERSDSGAVRKLFGAGAFDCVVDNMAWDGQSVSDLAGIGGKGIGRYILTSTAWVYLLLSPSEGEVLREDRLWPDASLDVRHGVEALRGQDLPDVTRRYVEGKIGAEKAAFSMACPATVLRPCMVSGSSDHNDRIGFYTRRVLDGGPVLVIEGPEAGFQLLWVDDLVGVMTAVIEADCGHRSVFNVAPAERTSVESLIALIEEETAHSVEKVHVPRSVVRERFGAYLDYEPLSAPVPGHYDGARLAGILPGMKFTGAARWVRGVVREVVQRGVQPEPAGRREEERAFANRFAHHQPARKL